MDDKNINIEELIVRVLENRADSEDIRYFSKWVEEIRNREYFEKLKKIWNLSAGGHANSEILEIGVRDFRLFMEKSLKPKKRVVLMWRMGSVAAVLLMILSSVLLSAPEGLLTISFACPTVCRAADGNPLY